MGIKLGMNMSLRNKTPLDDRQQFNTLTDMKDFPETSLPDGILSYNKEDSKTYQFNSANEVDETTGKWKEFVSGSAGGGSVKFDDDFTVKNVEIGKYKNGSVIKKETDILDVIKAMLTKSIPATYAAPVVGLTTSDELLFEKGTTYTPTVTPSFTQNDAGDIVGCKLYVNGSEEANEMSPSAHQLSITANSVVKYEVEYAEGAIKQDSEGENCPDGHITAGTIASKEIKFTGVVPFYYGVYAELEDGSVDVSGLTKDVSGKGNKTYSFTANDQVICIVYDASYPDIKSIIDPNGFDYVEGFDKAVSAINDGADAVKVYTIADPTTIDNFEFKINF